MIDFAEFSLARLDPEPWGARLTRAREKAALTVRDIEELTGRYVSRSAVSRLEARDVVPTKQPDRYKAMAILLLAKVDPRDFDLGPDDVPPFWDINALLQANVTNLCFSGRHLWTAGDTPNVSPLAA